MVGCAWRKRQINDNLEAMAKQLYDYWFVQFDFPDEDGKPYKSSGGAMVWNEKLKREIPQEWTAAKIKDVAQTYSGGALQLLQTVSTMMVEISLG